jgi:CheY-like chemotaxis protein
LSTTDGTDRINLVPFLKKVVVGEDEDVIAKMIEATLGDAGWLCLRGRNGEEAIELVQNESPDLLILDVLMPRLDGLETVRRLKADPVYSRVPVLMLTSLASIDDRVRGLDAGADDYLSKPFALRELLARCKALTRASRRERDRSPTTGLPGPGALDEAVEAWLQKSEQFALVFVAFAGFDRFTLTHGWIRGGELVAKLALALRGVVAGQPGTLLAHLGGDDFAVATAFAGAPALAAELRAAADELATSAELRVEVTVVGSDGARSIDDLANKVAAARARSR